MQATESAGLELRTWWLQGLDGLFKLSNFALSLYVSESSIHVRRMLGGGVVLVAEIMLARVVGWRRCIFALAMASLTVGSNIDSSGPTVGSCDCCVTWLGGAVSRWSLAAALASFFLNDDSLLIDRTINFKPR